MTLLDDGETVPGVQADDLAGEFLGAARVGPHGDLVVEAGDGAGPAPRAVVETEVRVETAAARFRLEAAGGIDDQQLGAGEGAVRQCAREPVVLRAGLEHVRGQADRGRHQRGGCPDERAAPSTHERADDRRTYVRRHGLFPPHARDGDPPET
ncbi:hypothetical protein ACFQ6Q_06450 [Streptomyces sp. NPDC056437]|uniref:hypothetical protein n=1 Tax=Streptomyces sp. NPDC056437 TaxID=3345816 RepID=UPI0036869F61